MAAFPQRSDLDEQQLIERHIDLNYERYPHGRADVWLRASRVSVWVLVKFLQLYQGDRDRVVREYDLSQEEMDAALAYYRRNAKYIDARIILSEA
jgi:uncharacterized protein (DUF433 family)